jgi:ribosomal protein S27AE
MQKTCFKCRQIKPLTEFYKHSAMGDGHLNKCKSCTRADVRNNRQAKADQYREFDRQRAQLPHRVEARKAYAQTEAGKQSKLRYLRSFRERQPEKDDARHQVAYALRTGRLTKRPCEVCGAGQAQAHHDDYSKPLDVRWLCVPHHNEHHRNHLEEAA